MNQTTIRSIRAGAVLIIVMSILGVIYCLFEINRIDGIYNETIKESGLAGALLTPVYAARKSNLQTWLGVWIVLGIICLIVDGIAYRYGKQLKRAALAPKCPFCLGTLPEDGQPVACQHCGRALAWFQNRPFSPEEAKQRIQIEQQRTQREYETTARVEQIQRETAARKAKEREWKQRIRREANAAFLENVTAKCSTAWNGWKSLIGTDSDAMAVTFCVIGGLFLGTVLSLVVLALR